MLDDISFLTRLLSRSVMGGMGMIKVGSGFHLWLSGLYHVRWAFGRLSVTADIYCHCFLSCVSLGVRRTGSYGVTSQQ
jgi:hypothetical protein